MVEVASLGLSTRGPTAKETRDLGLKFEVRARGQIVVGVENGGPGANASVGVGDVLMALDDVELYSADDIADILRTHAPGEYLSLIILRADTNKEEALEIKLGSSVEARHLGHRQSWDYASLAHLPAALAEAKARDKKVLIGLSGAET